MQANNLGDQRLPYCIYISYTEALEIEIERSSI